MPNFIPLFDKKEISRLNQNFLNEFIKEPFLIIPIPSGQHSHIETVLINKENIPTGQVMYKKNESIYFSFKLDGENYTIPFNLNVKSEKETLLKMFESPIIPIVFQDLKKNEENKERQDMRNNIIILGLGFLEFKPLYILIEYSIIADKKNFYKRYQNELN